MSADVETGKELPQCGQWTLLREIGRGAYGVVYLARRCDGTKAAVKVCRREDVPPERYERELRGAKLYGSIPRTTGLVHAGGLDEKPWGFYFAMDLADDEFGRKNPSDDAYRPRTLASVIGGEKALPLDECVKLGIALAKGLAELQRRHFLHRDIKPGNVIYVGGEPVLSDPGLVVDEREAASLVGTQGYDPPEGFIDPAGDLYSLGRTLKAASFGRRIEDLDKGPALEADTGAKHFPAWWRILNKASDPEPRRRYQSAKALLKDLQSLRRKMKVAAVFGSRLSKVAIAVAVIAFAAILAMSAIQSRKFQKDTEAMYESAVRETLGDDLRSGTVPKAVKKELDDVLKEINELTEGISKKVSRPK